ncbi:MAG: hypothetical protein E7447_06725 [Ruminococcaceae bacterium]|nr:hypothetical protein [Oscillospiraceae bacterium]
MVKGITKQVIVVHSPEPKLFEQAIFILKEDAVGEGITDEMLLKEAKRAVNQQKIPKNLSGAIWACAGAGVTGLVWLLSNIL